LKPRKAGLITEMSHWYQPVTGEVSEVFVAGWQPSVTTILRATKSHTDKQALAAHYMKGQLAAYEANRESQDRGNYVDRWIKAHLTNSPLPLVNYRFQPWCDQVRSHLNLLRSGEIMLMATPVFGDGYAGEPDLIVRLPTTGLTLVEFKTRDAPPIEPMIKAAHLQAAAYAEAYEYEKGTPIEQVQIVVIQSKFMQVFRSIPAWHLPEWHTRRDAYVATHPRL
jgi:hypothetical protein